MMANNQKCGVGVAYNSKIGGKSAKTLIYVSLYFTFLSLCLDYLYF